MANGVTSTMVTAVEPPRSTAPSRLQEQTTKTDEAASKGPQAVAEEKRPEAIDREKLDEAVRSLTDYVQNVRRELQFSVDDDTGRTVVKVMDSASGDVIRQIPAEEILVLARHLKEMEEGSQGLILRTQV